MTRFCHLTLGSSNASRRLQKGPQPAGNVKPRSRSAYLTINETISKATMLMTLIIGLIAGPAVSL